MSFGHHSDFDKFSRSIRRKSRFGLEGDSAKFVDEFKNQLPRRSRPLESGSVLYRAVCDYHYDEDAGRGQVDITGAPVDRMYPKPEFACEGRTNPAGIVNLYLASSRETAVSEVRPWVGELVSVGVFETTANLSLVDLSLGHDKFSISEFTLPELLGEAEISQEKTDQAVWNSIDSAFSRPTTRTDAGAEYAPTQYLSEVVRTAGYDGLFYKSAFGGSKGYNIVLFDLTAARIRKCEVHGIDALEVKFSEAGNPWFKSK